MCYFTCSAPEIIHSHCFYLISNKSKMVIMRPPAAPPPIKYTSSCREDQRCSTEGKIVSKYCNLSKTQGEGGSITPTPPDPLVPRRGYGFNCTSEGKGTCMSNTTYVTLFGKTRLNENSIEPFFHFNAFWKRSNALQIIFNAF